MADGLLQANGGFMALKSFNPYRAVRLVASSQILLLLVFGAIVLNIRPYIGRTTKPTYSHPIERLIEQNLKKHQEFVARQSKTPEQAVQAYKTRYKRDPPAGFLKWAQYAIQQNSSVIDDFDIIEERIAPFRSVSPADLRKRIQAWQDNADAFETIRIEDGKTMADFDGFKKSVQDIEGDLPNMELLYNWLDEPRIIGSDATSNEAIVENFAGKNSWSILTDKCRFPPQGERSWRGRMPPKTQYVEDPKQALDICSHPEFETKHGFFNCPSNFRPTRSLVPFFAYTSMSTMSDIITPGLDYVSVSYLGGADTVDKIPFAKKKNQVYWKAWSTGSNFTPDYWRQNHRIRFVQRFGKHPMFNIGFSKYVQCGGFCHELEEKVGLVPSEDAKTGFGYKFAMDIDGNGYSGRFYRLLLSNCLVLKQTMFVQWHDDRLVPWVHYVPVSLGLDDLEGALEYFANDPKGQVYAAQIAEGGKLWARQVLRPVDITIYTYRLLLEYAALFDEEKTASA
ncbi:hypothetical protein DRE_00347 [Drechslerella stenobrocha 248]|uniref:Glycosyl transferase CAP10 domain-containing protein n=1 Tax=Drechslerella stenobrocha 248 TaxID=1043628 RepID=W7HV19_9PEZI|nr:hypothetical protein DRE_00347 [Drechslerella stenobrocha 248]